MKLKFHILTLLLIVSSLRSYSQQYNTENFGINIGIVTAIGSTFDRFGVSVNSYYVKNNFQVNGGARFYFNFKNIGPDKQYFEAVTSLGVVYGFGKADIDSNLFFNPVSNQTFKTNSVGYAYNVYLNSIGTNQQTGTVSFQFNHFNLIAENDIFARPKLDRYRTGAFLLQYREGDIALGINTTLFTGEMGDKISDPNYPYSHLYKSDKDGSYSNVSHGLFSFQAQYITEHTQQLQANVGVDSERVRHMVQNRLIHDMIFLPKKWRKEDAAHIPMLDQNKKQYLFKEDQKVKKLKLYFNGYSNSGLFY